MCNHNYNHSLHARGMAFQPGEWGNPVAILFESPGKCESIYNRPLIGSTGDYYDILVSLISFSGDGELSDYLRKDRVMIVNACPRYICKNKYTTLTNELLGDNDETRKSIKEAVLGKECLICFGEFACKVYDKLHDEGAFEIPTVIKCFHIGEQGLMHFTPCSDDCKIKKLEVLSRYISKAFMRKGLNGWKELKKLFPQSNRMAWRMKGDMLVDGPEWM